MATLSSMLSVSESYAEAINIEFGQFPAKIMRAYKATETFNNKLTETAESAKTTGIEAGKIFSVIKDMAIKGMKIADDFTNTNIRIGAMTNGLDEQLQLQQQIFDSANRSRGVYSDMANAITKMGLSAPDMFGSNDELIAFTELVQKGIKLGGAEQSVQSDTMSQITEAMASGTLQGDDFAAIMENAPMLADAMSEATGKSITELQAMALEGEITSDILKNAIFMAANDINSEFDNLPVTFADIWNRIKNGALEAFGPVIQAISGLISSDGFNTLVNGILIGINLISMGIGGLISFLTGNWPIIQSLLMATGIYLAATLVPGFIAAGWAGLQAAYRIAAAWVMANLPLLTIIATIAMMIYGLQQAGVTVEDVFGFIGGFIGATVAVVRNLLVGFLELILGIINFISNIFVVFINFFANAFENPISSAIYLFQGLADIVLGIIEKIASALDFVLGTKMAETVSGWRSGLKEMADAAVAKYAPNENYQKIIETNDLGVEDFGLQRMKYGESWAKGDSIGRKAYGGLGDKLSELTDAMTKDKDEDKGYNPDDFKEHPITVKGTGTGDKVNVDMSDEDLKYLRDIAERDYINKFSTATLAPNIQVTFGDVHETADANAVAGRIKTILQEEIAMSAEGAYR